MTSYFSKNQSGKTQYNAKKSCMMSGILLSITNQMHFYLRTT
ncbi:MAG: hypothetical protein MZV63_29465 [Marinilabiliales bacterium]|nr:hypothetical protein [Marinilabiliales bacterium]